MGELVGRVMCSDRICQRARRYRLRRPQGHGFFKGGHDGSDSQHHGLHRGSQRCVVILSNDVRSEAGFADLVRFILGDTGVPYGWEYGAFAASRRAAYFALTSRAPALTPPGPKQPLRVSSRTPARVT